MMINSFSDFISALRKAGFSVAGSRDEGIFSLSGQFGDNIHWHTDDPDTDPWEWRMRVLEDFSDIAYGKIFFNKGGFITKEWYPFFFAMRRDGKAFEDEYMEGLISREAKKIYETIRNAGRIPSHDIKRTAGFTKEDNSKFERALIELQMKMYTTTCGRQRKVSLTGEEYGWSSAVFCTVEDFLGEDMLEKASKVTKREAVERITERIYKLNPEADTGKIVKFIKG